uniref:ATP synthase subunit a n=1 Tax=Pyramimonas parkeae TaxID=36894 RepID=A0A1D8I1T7_9CHLO|nr:ATP synthase F0 subunit a [Pyramimonas parkeae]AOT98939.1 ATP synthase F0 subunit a [Pyramimonas parkeae]
MNIFLYSPLEQFNIDSYITLSLGYIDFSITNAFICFFVASCTFLYLLSLATNRGGMLIPTHIQSLIELIYEFLLNLVKEQIGEKGKVFFPFIFTLFTFLVSCNLIGMVPYSFTVTSHFIVTFGLSVSVFVGMTLVGFYTHGLHFFSFLLPPGAPLILAPLLVVLELVSYSFRAISLGVRLFANMMAGHTLVKILAGFSWTMMSAGGLLAIASLIPFGIVFALTGLEIGVAILQAYVFTILTCIYLNDAIHLH